MRLHRLVDDLARVLGGVCGFGGGLDRRGAVEGARSLGAAHDLCGDALDLTRTEGDGSDDFSGLCAERSPFLAVDKPESEVHRPRGEDFKRQLVAPAPDRFPSRQA